MKLDLRLPIVQAPMAGGISTPRLAAEVSRAGGLGFLAAGYLPASEVAAHIEQVRQHTDAPFGVNVFVPNQVTMDSDIESYQDRLRAEAAARDIVLPEPDPGDTHDWENKVRLLLDTAPAAVSFTFGAPDANLVRQLHEVGSHVTVTVTSVTEAREAAEIGADALCVQGPRAGGHRATFDQYTEPGTQALEVLLSQISAATALPLIAAGGLSTADDIAAVLASERVMAAQLGTAYLCTPEAGTSGTHRAALHDPRFSTTTLTRAFSGRWARGLRNRFITEHADAPAGFPVIDQLTKPLRAAAARRDDPESLHLWAGTGFRQAGNEPAGQLTTRLGEAALHRR